MKVLFTFGGMPHYLIALLNNIQQSEKYEVVAVIPRNEGKTIGKGVKQEFKGINFKIIETPEYITYYRKPFFKRFLEIIKTEKPQIIITCWPYILGFVLFPRLYFYLKKNKIKITLKEIPFNVPIKGQEVTYFKSNPIYDEELNYQKTSGIKFYINIYFLRLLRSFYYEILNASFIYVEKGREIQTSYGVKPSSIFVTYNSPDTDALFQAKEIVVTEQKVLSDNNYRLIHIGRLVKWKRVDMLIKAFAKVKNKFQNAELIIIGDGPQDKELKQLAINLNIQNSVIFTGGIYNNVTLGKYISESTIYVLAGMGGLSINEAMVFGKPVICSVCDGTENHLVHEGKNGVYFKNGDESDLYQKIIYLFEQPTLIKEMGLVSEHIIKNEINIHTMVNKYIEGFNYLLNLDVK